MTAYVVSGLAQAKSAGYAKAEANLGGGVAYLQKQLAQHPRHDSELRAYVVYSLSEGRRRRIWAQRSKPCGRGAATFPPKAWPLPVWPCCTLEIAAHRRLRNCSRTKARHSGTLVSWPSSYNPLLDLSDDNSAESTAFALRFLTHAGPKSPLLEGAAQWLVLNRNDGYRWNSTEQTAMVIFGLADYLAASQELNADFDVDVSLNGASIGKRHFSPADAVSGVDLSLDVAAASCTREVMW